LIGYSALEHADPSMGVRSGHFYPEPGYAALEPLFHEFTLAASEAGPGVSESDRRSPGHIRLEEIREQLRALSLRIETSTGEHIPSQWIDIYEYFVELGEREVILYADDYLVYERFFGESV
jgi:hypothetical protein